MLCAREHWRLEGYSRLHSPPLCFPSRFGDSGALRSFVLMRLCLASVAALGPAFAAVHGLCLWLARTAGAACRLGSTLASAVVAHGVSRGVPAELLHSAWHPSSPPGLNPRLPPCEMDSQPLDHQGTPLILRLYARLCLLSSPPLQRGER